MSWNHAEHREREPESPRDPHGALEGGLLCASKQELGLEGGLLLQGGLQNQWPLTKPREPPTHSWHSLLVQLLFTRAPLKAVWVESSARPLDGLPAHPSPLD